MLTTLPLLDNLEVTPEAATPRLPRISWKVRRGPILHANPLNDDPSVLSLNIAQGCMHRCTFCSIRGHASYRGDEEIHLYAKSAKHLAAELAKRTILPRAVVISPSCDPFAPSLLIQEETLSVVRVLAEYGIESWLMTRGLIRPKILHGLAAYCDKVRIRVAMTTADRQLQRSIEPLTAPPVLRMRQLRRLRAMGIRVDVAIEPLLLGVTDTRENLLPLLRGLVESGIESVSVGYAFMRSGIRANIEKAVEAAGVSMEEIDEATKRDQFDSWADRRGQVPAARRRERSYCVGHRPWRRVGDSRLGLRHHQSRFPQASRGAGRPRRALAAFAAGQPIRWMMGQSKVVAHFGCLVTR